MSTRKQGQEVACSSPKGLRSLAETLALWEALLVASSMTALRLVVLLFLESVGGSENGLCCSVVGDISTRAAAFGVEGTESSEFAPLGVDDCLRLLLPTRTTWARTAVAVFALALFKKVEPTLNVLSEGLGAPCSYFFRLRAGTGGVEPWLKSLLMDAPLGVVLTLTMAALARIPVCAGVKTTPDLP